MIKKLMITGSALVLLGATTLTHSAVIVSLGSALPSEEMILSSLTPGNRADTSATGNFAWRRNNATNTNNWDVAISFQAQGTGTLNELGIYLNSNQTGGGNAFTIQIRQYDTAPSGSNAVNGGTLLLTNNSGTINVADQTGSILVFSFTAADVVTLTDGKWYSVSLIWPSSDPYNSTKNFSFLNTATGYNDDETLISAGGWRRNPGGSWTHDTGRNYLFYASTAIPEPSTYALLGTAALGMALYRRRHGKQ